MFRAYIYKLFRSPLFYAGIFGTTLLCISNVFIGRTTSDVTNRIDIFLDIDSYRKVIAVFSALPFTANFADEWNHGVTNHIISRESTEKYAVSNVLFCSVTSFLAVFVGMMIFAFGCSFFQPVYTYNELAYTYVYGDFLMNWQPWIYITLRIFMFAWSCSMWSVMGLMLSSFLPNKYVAICSPLVASYVVERITIQFPTMLNLWYLSLSQVRVVNSLLTFLYSFFIFALISLICGVVFVITVKRRIRNELA